MIFKILNDFTVQNTNISAVLRQTLIERHAGKLITSPAGCYISNRLVFPCSPEAFRVAGERENGSGGGGGGGARSGLFERRRDAVHSVHQIVFPMRHNETA